MWFDQKMRTKMNDFGVRDDKVLGEGPLLYGDFMVPNTDNKIYEEIVDNQKVRERTYFYIQIVQNQRFYIQLYMKVKCHKLSMI